MPEFILITQNYLGNKVAWPICILLLIYGLVITIGMRPKFNYFKNEFSNVFSIFANILSKLLSDCSILIWFWTIHIYSYSRRKDKSSKSHKKI